MSIMKNPVILAIIVSVLVFTVMYYWHNPMFPKDKKKKDTKNKDKDKKKIKKGINETVIISSVIAGLATWYITSSYFTNKPESLETVPVSVPRETVPDTGLKGGSRIVNSKVPHIESDDPTRSYNLIGSGLNIPRSELSIPNVLIDYK
jgi:hypothetical protein